ncbi:MAG TPA: hypothetical protein VFV63_19655 [Ilumatobacteraceae bacterium]|nr:hypothetical protein [Ilumatobacteraceae bacterium]
MSSPAGDQITVAVDVEKRRGFRHSLMVSTRGALLGAAAGAWAGLLVGGAGGRLAMFVLRLTSPNYVRGIKSDDEFEIGRFSFDTVFLLALTTIAGAVVGMVFVAIRRALPVSWRVWAWTLVGGTVGGSLILHADGVDFNVLEPTWLAVVMFVTIPAGGAALMAVWVERWDRWWFTYRRRTIVTALPTVLLVPVIFPLVVAVAAVVAVSVASQSGTVRAAVGRVGPPIGRVALVIVAALASWALFNDITEIL